MEFINLTVERVVVHEIFQRNEEKLPVQPRYGSSLVNLDHDAMQAFKFRLVEALGKDSQCQEMNILRYDDGSFLNAARELLDTNNCDFPNKSKKIADKLVEAQLNRTIPGGMVVVFSGTIGHPAQRYLGCIKAEPHDGFTLRRDDEQLSLELLKDLFLTPKAKLYKIGMFIEPLSENAPKGNDAELMCYGFTACVYDALMTTSNRDAAAQYFYEGFLGCAFPENAARMTKNFFETTRAFINNSGFSTQKKYELSTALYTYLKVDQRSTIAVSDFATTYLPPSDADVYINFMREKKFPTHAVTKDTNEIKTKLRNRNLKFHSGIKINGPAEKLAELVSFESIESPPDESGMRHIWTVVTVKDQMANEV